jgi:hypothetical protein
MDDLFAHTREIRSGSGSGSRSRSYSRTRSAPRRRSSTLHPALLKAELGESASSKLRGRYYEDASPSPSPFPSPSLAERKLIIPHRYEHRHSEPIPSPNIIINADPSVLDENCISTGRRESPSARKEQVATGECVDIQSLLSQWTTLSPQEIARGTI